MHIEVQCKGCQARYRLKEEFAGRMARCKHCGQTFRVPYRSRVMALDDTDHAPEPENQPQEQAQDDEQDPSHDEESAAGEERSFEEYGIRERKKESITSKDDAAQPILPHIVAELWLPLTLCLLGYGIAIFLAVNKMLNSPGPLAGILLIATMIILHLALIIPMTMRTLEGAAKTVEFDLPNSIWLQTAAALALPSLLGTIGLFAGGAGGAVAGVLIGVALMLPAMMLMYGIDVTKAVQATLLGAIFYLMNLGGSILVLLGIGLLIFPIWHMNVPWREPEETVATTAPPVSTPTLVAPKPEPAPVALAPATQPSIFQETTQPLVQAPKGPEWNAKIDPPQQPVKWPTDIHLLLDVQPPVLVVRAAGASPFVSLFDLDSVDTYDLHTGKRAGVIKERLHSSEALLSPGGKYLLARRSGGRSFAPANVSGRYAAPTRPPTAMMPTGGLEIWSTVEGRVLTHFGGDTGILLRPIGFAGSERIVSSAMSGSRSVIQVWDAPSGQLMKTFDAEVGSLCAISPGGKFLACVNPQAPKLSVYDLAAGQLAGEAPLPEGAQLQRCLSFSNAGGFLATIINDGLPPLKMLIWDMNTGQPAGPFPMSSARADMTADDLRWFPDDSSIVVGLDLIDRASGKMFHRLNPPAMAGTVGPVRAVLSGYHFLYEYLPVGNVTKLIYKSAPVPKGEVDTALKTLRGPGWTPEALAAAAIPTSNATAASATTGPAGDGAAAADAAPKPITLLDRVKQKEWVVSIVVVRQTDVKALDDQIRTERARLPDIDERFNKARVYADKLEGEKADNYDSRGHFLGQKNARTNKEIGDARVVADRINEEKRTANQRIARLERQKKDALTTRIVAATLDDGTAVTLDCEGQAIVSIADTLTPETKWKVVGVARIAEGELHIKPRAFTPPD